MNILELISKTSRFACCLYQFWSGERGFLLAQVHWHLGPRHRGWHALDVMESHEEEGPDIGLRLRLMQDEKLCRAQSAHEWGKKNRREHLKVRQLLICLGNGNKSQRILSTQPADIVIRSTQELWKLLINSFSLHSQYSAFYFSFPFLPDVKYRSCVQREHSKWEDEGGFCHFSQVGRHKPGSALINISVSHILLSDENKLGKKKNSISPLLVS